MDERPTKAIVGLADTFPILAKAKTRNIYMPKDCYCDLSAHVEPALQVLTGFLQA
jgi:hypothetical protein